MQRRLYRIWTDVSGRYAIMRNGAPPQYLWPVKFLGGNTDFNAFSPRESIRIKMKGGCLNFMHGGISLQEIVVPVIEYHFLRNKSKEFKTNKNKYDTKFALRHCGTSHCAFRDSFEIVSCEKTQCRAILLSQ